LNIHSDVHGWLCQRSMRTRCWLWLAANRWHSDQVARLIALLGASAVILPEGRRRAAALYLSCEDVLSSARRGPDTGVGHLLVRLDKMAVDRGRSVPKGVSVTVTNGRRPKAAAPLSAPGLPVGNAPHFGHWLGLYKGPFADICLYDRPANALLTLRHAGCENSSAPCFHG
jgi:hypothetical protein